MSYDWKWYLKDIKQDKDVSVFSCFACTGGSSMGYKRAGFKVLGCCEIDKRVNDVYVRNHHPKYNFLMDLREFNALDNSKIPEELFHLDILDGSPPCSAFSMAGQREKNWNKAKTFREGQKTQTLDDLFFVLLDTVEKLQPKIVVAENVTGLLLGNAKGYVNEIINRFKSAGYSVQLFRLNSAFMNVPQARERVFFVANRMGYRPLKLEFNEKPITFGEVRTAHGKTIKSELLKKRLSFMQKGDNKIADITKRTENGRSVCFNDFILWDDRVACTLTAGGIGIRACDKSLVTDDDCRNVQSFPQDFDFGNENVRYVCGMSVPPNMMANIATQIWEQWLNGKTKN